MKRMAFMLVCLVLALARTGEAQVPPTPGFPPNPAALAPPTPVSHPTPVAFFRQLLAMTPGERVHALTNRPVAIRGKIMAKVKEYLALDPNERELRLQATELRWYLAPLMRLPAAQRGARLAQVPDQWRNIVQSRLSEWDILPPPLQQELLTNNQAVPYFTQVNNPPAAAPATRSEQLAAQFDQYFELSPHEKEQALKTLSAPEQAQMEKTLQAFAKLSPPRRHQCLRNYATFAGMTSAERTEFLTNASRWAQMTPAERQTWRDLVNRVPHLPPMPGMPGPTMPPPPLPTGLAAHVRLSVATNLN